MDISFFSSEHDPNDPRACAALVVFELDASGALTVVWEDFEFVYMNQPYIAGFLAFREVPHFTSSVGTPSRFPSRLDARGHTS
jgi:DnaJ family protein A protein 2